MSQMAFFACAFGLTGAKRWCLMMFFFFFFGCKENGTLLFFFLFFRTKKTKYYCCRSAAAWTHGGVDVSFAKGRAAKHWQPRRKAATQQAKETRPGGMVLLFLLFVVLCRFGTRSMQWSRAARQALTSRHFRRRLAMCLPF